MSEAVESFFHRVAGDAALAERLHQAGGAEEVVGIAGESGDHFTVDEFRTWISRTDELSDEDMESVAGGGAAGAAGQVARVAGKAAKKVWRWMTS